MCKFGLFSFKALMALFPRALMALSLMVSVATADTMYEWTDQYGKKHFSSTPPEQEEFEKKEIKQLPKTGAKVVSDRQLQSYERNKSSASASSSGSRDDSYCIRKRRQLFNIEAGLERVEIEAERNRANALKKVIAERCGGRYLSDAKSRQSEYRRSGHCYDKKLDLMEILDLTDNREGAESKELRAYIKRECGSQYLP